MHSNYVLIKPDEQLETFQFKGKESGLYAPDFKYENGKKITVKERNMSVFGTVYGIPEKLTFNRDEIENIKNNNTLFRMFNGERIPVNISKHRELADLTRNSVMFDTIVEVNKGDRVNFSYQAHKKAKEDKMIIDTEEGEMYLIKYDMLYMTVDKNLKPNKMLNGYILLQPEEIEVKQEGAQEFIELGNGLVGLAPKYKIKKTRKTQKGIVLKVGNRCKGYLQFPDRNDFIDKIEEGQQVMYDPRLCQKLEFDTHQIMSDKLLHLAQRKDVIYMYEKEAINV